MEVPKPAWARAKETLEGSEVSPEARRMLVLEKNRPAERPARAKAQGWEVRIENWN